MYEFKEVSRNPTQKRNGNGLIKSHSLFTIIKYVHLKKSSFGNYVPKLLCLQSERDVEFSTSLLLSYAISAAHFFNISLIGKSYGHLVSQVPHSTQSFAVAGIAL